MASHGKEICRQLKGIRRKIAEENDIRLDIPECTFEGECRGTCPRCEAEVKYLERELSRRIAVGKVAAVAGIAAATLAVASCNRDSSYDNDADNPAIHDEDAYEGIVTGEPIPEEIPEPTPYDDWEVMTTPSGSRLLVERGGEAENWGREAVNAILSPEEEIYIVCDKDPVFPGGMEALYRYIEKNLRYPQEAQKAHISGKVFVTFVIEKDGSVSNVKLLRDIGGGCGEEAIRLVKAMPRWTPGKEKGKVVRTQFNLPVPFIMTCD